MVVALSNRCVSGVTTSMVHRSTAICAGLGDGLPEHGPAQRDQSARRVSSSTMAILRDGTRSTFTTFGDGKFTSKNCLNGEQKLLSFGPVFGRKGAIYPGLSAPEARIERAKAGKFARELTETIQNDPHLKRLLSPSIVKLLT